MRKSNYMKMIILTILLLVLSPINSVVNAQNNINKIPGILAKNAIVMDMDTGEVIASQNADKQVPVASTIKLLTSLIFAENTQKSQMIPFTEDSLKTTQTSLNNFMNIDEGDKISSNDLMKAVMIYSANDAAYLMADSVAGNTKDFVKMMNDRVKEMGLKNTKVYNPSGLENDALNPDKKDINLSSAYDIAIIATEAYKNDWIKEIVSDKYKKTDINVSGRKIEIETRNQLLSKNGNEGGKTGNETKAGHCFVGFYERDGRNLVTVALNSEYGADGTNVFNDTKKIADYGYDAKEVEYKEAGEELTKINLEYKIFRFFGKTKTIGVPVIATKDIMYYENELNNKNIKITYNDEDKDAWKLANKDITLDLQLLEGKEEIVGKVDISGFELLKSNIKDYVLAFVGFIIALIILACIIKFINRIKNNRRRKNIYSRKRKRNIYSNKRR